MDHFKNLEILQYWITEGGTVARVEVDGFFYTFRRVGSYRWRPSDFIEVRRSLPGQLGARERDPVIGRLDADQEKIYRARLAAFEINHPPLRRARR